MISANDVKHVAKLSKLEFNNEEIESFRKDMDAIIEYVNTLSKVDTSNVKENLNTINFNDLREDNVKPSLSQEEAILNAPKKFNGGFGVPQVID